MSVSSQTACSELKDDENAKQSPMHQILTLHGSPMLTQPLQFWFTFHDSRIVGCEKHGGKRHFSDAFKRDMQTSLCSPKDDWPRGRSFGSGRCHSVMLVREIGDELLF
jgi:hypothetical protein